MIMERNKVGTEVALYRRRAWFNIHKTTYAQSAQAVRLARERYTSDPVMWGFMFGDILFAHAWFAYTMKAEWEIQEKAKEEQDRLVEAKDVAGKIKPRQTLVEMEVVSLSPSTLIRPETVTTPLQAAIAASLEAIERITPYLEWQHKRSRFSIVQVHALLTFYYHAADEGELSDVFKEKTFKYIRDGDEWVRRIIVTEVAALCHKCGEVLLEREQRTESIFLEALAKDIVQTVRQAAKDAGEDFEIYGDDFKINYR
jgi:hypothetical protein